MPMPHLEDDAEFIPRAALPVRVGRSRQADLRLREDTVSRLHALLDEVGGRIRVQDLGSRFGTHVNGVQVRQRLLDQGDQVRFGQVVTYQVGADGLYRVEQTGLDLRVQEVVVSVGGRVLVTLGRRSWVVPSGKLVGILGPSGAGKTMLLRVLAGVRRPSQGTVACGLWSDIWQDIDAYRRRLAYLPQEDILYPLLTVQENLRFAANLRLGDSLSATERERRVADTLQLFELEEHAQKLVAHLSGGQRKRVSVALEWLRQPELFLLDEPTAGLDPANETRLMEYLRALTRRGTTVVCTTHLMENIYLLDEVLVLGVRDHQGQVAYVGPPNSLLDHFQCRQFADLYERLESGQFTPWDAPADPRTEADQAQAAAPESSSGQATPASTATPRLSLRHLAIAPEREIQMRALKVVAGRSLLNLWRDSWARSLILGQPVVLALVVALTQFSPGKLFGLLFFSSVVACWLGMNNAIRDLVRDRRHYIRDRLGGLAPGSYLLAKWLVYGLIGAGQLLVFLVLLRLLVVRIAPEYFALELARLSLLGWLGVCWLIYLGGLGLALVVSTLVASEEAAVAWLPLLILPQVLLSASATGVAPLEYTDARPFRPLAVTLRHPWSAVPVPGQKTAPEPLSKTALAADVLSLVLVCRPGVLLLEQPRVEGFGASLAIADFCHLIILILGTALVQWVVFLRCERRWPALVGY
jgi:ABC-type multidrug transport system ATPase subunit